MMYFNQIINQNCLFSHTFTKQLVPLLVSNCVWLPPLPQNFIGPIGSVPLKRPLLWFAVRPSLRKSALSSNGQTKTG